MIDGDGIINIIHFFHLSINRFVREMLCYRLHLYG